ncbi:hypothetical protein [Exiguobacterium artemiae]|uniref:hypothetical protein n=1 Tax=Exiguobacterium artemiae TaxID=340145 RepID=UPI002963FB2A|nr:hypothetical protein [Exiguobacterium sibiricum]MDW2886778.1 hypothetical protein [Exiguobacterium sibiricum]
MSKKVLIISNNVLSTKNNNGKTIFSFFKDKQKSDISQLYFSDESIEIEDIEYFQINDKMMIKKISKLSTNLIDSKKYDKKIKLETVKSDYYTFLKSQMIKSDGIRIIREYIWKRNTWYENELFEWIKKNNPSSIFFCAGDSGFAYDLVEKIKLTFNLKLATFITDDYVLPRQNHNIFSWLRRKYILKKFKRNIMITDQFFTISPKMKKTYNDLFGIESELLVNISGSNKSSVSNATLPSNLLYAGGLHYGRDKILIKLSNAIEAYNNSKGIKNKLSLEIYSHQNVSKSFTKKIKNNTSTSFLGSIDQNKLQEKLRENIIPVHVESFKKKHIDSTKLSLSTKIPEYLSLGKPILAIGPSNISSMEYLSSVAYCINKEKNMDSELKTIFLNNNDYEIKIKMAEKLYEENHNKDKVLKKFNEYFYGM